MLDDDSEVAETLSVDPNIFNGEENDVRSKDADEDAFLMRWKKDAIVKKKSFDNFTTQEIVRHICWMQEKEIMTTLNHFGFRPKPKSPGKQVKYMYTLSIVSKSVDLLFGLYTM